MESKSERFKRVATRRTNAILKQLDVLGHCANRSAYDYTDEEVNKIFAEIDKAMKLVKMRFQLNDRKKKKFKL